MSRNLIIRAGVRAGAVALAALALATAAAAEEMPGTPPPTITVTGEGQVGAAPDMAHVGVGVVQEAGTAAEAVAAMSEATARVLALLAEAGLASQDVQTGQLSLEPRYADRDNATTGPRIVGFTATTLLDLRVRDLSQLGAVLDAAVVEGANRLNGVRFALQDPKPAMDAARRAAVADAQARAALFAEAAGVDLGEVLRISETTQFNGPRPMMEASFAMDRMAIPVAEGEVNLTAQVTMVYRIGE